MILNERQHRVTKAAAERLQKRIRNLERAATATNLAPQKRTLLRAAAQGQLAELMQQLEEYEALRKGAIPIAPIPSLAELPLALIRARIARGWTQARLAEALKVAEQQVQRDESNAYRSASLERIRKIADVLGVRVIVAVELSRSLLGDRVEQRMRRRRDAEP